MTTSYLPTTKTTLKKEQELFGSLFIQLCSALLNRVLDLSPATGTRRLRYLLILFFVSVILISLRFYPLALWVRFVQDIFLYSFNPAYAVTYVGNPFANFLRFAYLVFTDPRALQYIPILLTSFFIALQCGALYLADIFELERVSVARSFMMEAALSSANEAIRISQGDISEQSRESPVFLIGGPGKVIVDVDSVALFEKPDGTPHIIEPTTKEPGGIVKLDGFERFRQAIDIRDQYVNLSVTGRSQEGIPITATNIHTMFSIYRGENAKRTAESPYPFSQEAVEQIIYKSVSRVTPELPNPSTYEFSWINNMIGLIRGQLNGFMGEHKLSEYLASTGMPEFEKLKQREEMIVEEVQKLTRYDPNLVSVKEFRRPPEFQPRYKITNLFTQFAEEFTKRAQNSGVELHWIGVGTWKTSIELVPEAYLKAWKLSQKNQHGESAAVLNRLEETAIISMLQTLINAVPVKVYQDILSSTKRSEKSSEKPDSKLSTTEAQAKDKVLSEEEIEEISLTNLVKAISDNTASTSTYELSDADNLALIRTLLLEYRKQLIEAVEFMTDENEAVPPNIEKAIRHIDNQIVHWASKDELDYPTSSSRYPHSTIDHPKPVVIMKEAIALSRIKDLPTNKRLQVGQIYHLEVDVIRDLENSSLSRESLSEKFQAIGVAVQADNMIIQPDWFHDVVISPDGTSQSPEFILIPQEPGYKTITVQYYYKSHWLTQVTYYVEVIQNGQSKSETLYPDLD